LDINRDAKRRTHLVLTRIKASNSAGVIVICREKTAQIGIEIFSRFHDIGPIAQQR
jgi:hypothetical protein